MKSKIVDDYFLKKHEEFIKDSDKFLDAFGKRVGVDLSPEAREAATISRMEGFAIFGTEGRQVDVLIDTNLATGEIKLFNKKWLDSTHEKM